MAFVYIVRCNFTEPAREQAWNDWYSGPKIAQMLAKPHFRTCQRFRRTAGRGRNYLALWMLQSPDAFDTTEYRSDWGFFDWSPYIADWSRDLFDGGDAPEATFAVPPDGSLRIVSFDGMSLARADAARAALTQAEPETIWLPVVGLDRHTPLIGLNPRPDLAPPDATNDAGNSGAQRAIYRPISDLCTAAPS
jgi:hypothetical protein